MSQHIATFIFVVGIAGLFYLDRNQVSHVSKGLWIPVLWLLIVGSRPVSLWFQSGAPTSGAPVSLSEQYADGSPVDAAIFGALVLAGIVVLSMRSRRVKACILKNWPILLFFLFCALSIMWSDYSFVAFKRWIKAVGDMVMVLIVLTDPDPLDATKRFFSRATFVLLPVSVLFIKYYPDLGRAYNQWSWVPMYTGVTTVKNMLGLTCLVCGLSSVWSFTGAFQDKKMPHRVRHMIAHGAMVAMAIWLIMTADSKTSLACLFMASTPVVLTLQKRHATRVRIANSLIGGAVVLSLFALFVDPSTVLPSLGRDSSLTGRTDIWQAVLSMHSNPFVGTGFESFWMGSRLDQVDNLTEKGIQEAHNGYLEVYLNLGFAGIALLAGVMVMGYRNILAVFRRDPHAGRLRLAFFSAGIIYSFTEAGFRMMSPIWIAFLFAVTYVLPDSRKEKPQFSKFRLGNFGNSVVPLDALRVESGLRSRGEIDITLGGTQSAEFHKTRI